MDKDFVKYCLNNNELNHATAVFYLLENYDHIEQINIYMCVFVLMNKLLQEMLRDVMWCYICVDV